MIRTFLLYACLLLPVFPAAGQTIPEPVSPGGDDGGLIESRCPVFSWAGIEDAIAYELVVLAVDGVANQIRVSQGARSWTPSIGQCFRRGDHYAWAVRAVTDEGEGEWSEPALFRVAPDGPEQEAGAMRVGASASVSATPDQGLVEYEPRSFGIIPCAAGQVVKRNAGGTGWECAPDLTGGAGDPGALAEDSVTTLELGDASTPTAGYAVIVDSDGVRFDYAELASSPSTGGLMEWGPDTIAVHDCPDGQILKSASGVWGCAADETGGTGTGGGLTALADDESPQLGADLDVNGFEIADASGSRVVIGSGLEVLGGSPLVRGNGTADLHIDPNGRNVHIGDGINGIEVSADGRMTAVGTGSIDTTGAAADDQPFGTVRLNPSNADSIPLLRAPRALTITSIHCIVDPADSGESVVIDIRECNSTGDACVSVDAPITCINTGAGDDGSFSNAVIDAGDWLLLDVGTVTGTVTAVAVTGTWR